MATDNENKDGRGEIRLRTYPETKKKELENLAAHHGVPVTTYIIMRMIEHTDAQPIQHRKLKEAS